MKRRATMFALVFSLSLMGGCETCVLPGCEPCDEPCMAYAAPCGASYADPCESRPDTRSSIDWLSDLRSSDRAARDRAVDALSGMGPGVLSDVGSLLSDPDPAIRFSALQVFVRLRQHAWTSVWYVRNRLTDSDAAIRADAAYVIGMSGESGAEAVPQLICALNDSSPYVRYHAAVAFQKMGAHGKPALRALERASRCDRDPRVREAARCAIARIKKATCG